jgi:hypothetical protein
VIANGRKYKKKRRCDPQFLSRTRPSGESGIHAGPYENRLAHLGELIVLLAAIPLAACVGVPPSGPTVVAMPRSGETLTQFQANDLACRNYAQIHTAPPGATQAAANRSAVGSAAVGTAVGAAGGALLAGNAGAGAAIGAGAGLLTGSAVDASNASAIAGGAQGQYGYAP